METKPAKQTFIQTILGKKDGCGEKKMLFVLCYVIANC